MFGYFFYGCRVKKPCPSTWSLCQEAQSINYSRSMVLSLNLLSKTTHGRFSLGLSIYMDEIQCIGSLAVISETSVAASWKYIIKHYFDLTGTSKEQIY